MSVVLTIKSLYAPFANRSACKIFGACQNLFWDVCGNHTYCHGDSNIVIDALALALLMSEWYSGSPPIMTRPGRGQGVFIITRVGSGRVRNRFLNSTVGPRGFKNVTGRVGSGTQRFVSLAGQAVMTRELFSAEWQVKTADLASGSAFFTLTAEGHCSAGAPWVRPADG